MQIILVFGGADKRPIEVPNDATVTRLLELIKEKEEVTPEYIKRLVFAGNDIKEKKDEKLSTLGIVEGSRVQVVLELRNRPAAAGRRRTKKQRKTRRRHRR